MADITRIRRVQISTHSRAKAAGVLPRQRELPQRISTHSRAKAAGIYLFTGNMGTGNFNSQPREGGWAPVSVVVAAPMYFNSQPREGGWSHAAPRITEPPKFQLTAARRRLGSLRHGF